MKAILVLFTFISSTSFAMSIDTTQMVYEALDVKAYNPRPGAVGSVASEKSVGGLTCTKQTEVRPRFPAKFKCIINPKKEDFKAIYNALKVPEIASGRIGGGKFYLKKVGQLECTKKVISYSNYRSTYDCFVPAGVL